jgi:hypothetical protein
LLLVERLMLLLLLVLVNMLVKEARNLHPVQFLFLARRFSSRIFSGRRIGASNQEFRWHFGVPPVVCSDVWRIGSFQAGTRPVYILWALLFMFTYMTETILCSMIGVDPKTFRKWVWPVIHSIAAVAPRIVSFCLVSCVILYLLFLTICSFYRLN